MISFHDVCHDDGEILSSTQQEIRHLRSSHSISTCSRFERSTIFASSAETRYARERARSRSRDVRLRRLSSPHISATGRETSLSTRASSNELDILTHEVRRMRACVASFFSSSARGRRRARRRHASMRESAQSASQRSAVRARTAVEEECVVERSPPSHGDRARDVLRDEDANASSLVARAKARGLRALANDLRLGSSNESSFPRRAGIREPDSSVRRGGYDAPSRGADLTTATSDNVARRRPKPTSLARDGGARGAATSELRRRRPVEPFYAADRSSAPRHASEHDPVQEARGYCA